MSKTNSTVTVERVRELINYDELTGVFTRKKNMGSRGKAGDVLNTVTKNGYQIIRIDGVAFYGHRLAWYYLYGYLPDCDIDHIDGNRLNNSIANLRLATRSENMQNLRKPQKNNTSGYLGVTWHAQMKKWAAQTTHNGKHKSLGLYNSAEEAKDAYISFKRMNHLFNTI